MDCKVAVGGLGLKTDSAMKKALPSQDVLQDVSDGRAEDGGCEMSLAVSGKLVRVEPVAIFWHEEHAEQMLLLRTYYKSKHWQVLTNKAFATPLQSAPTRLAASIRSFRDATVR